MVLDFMVLKDLYRMLIEPFVEHQNLNETMASPDLEVRYPLWTVIKQGEDPMEPKRVPLTTAEGLARWCLLNFEHGLYTLMDRSQLTYRIQVIVWETSTSYAKIGSEWRDNG
jgi:6-pyruvoyl-tetrahydropterin synthase